MSDPALALLERSFKRTARGMIVVGFGILALGLFMMALHLFDLDPETMGMGMGMGMGSLITLYFFALLFAATGLAVMYVGVVKAPRDAFAAGTRPG